METNVLPKKWVLKKLGNVAKWSSGGTPKATNADYYNGDIPWLVIGDLTDGDITTSQKKITAEGLKNSSAKMVPVDSVLVAMYGSIGKLGIAKIPCTTNQAIAFTESLNGVSTKYLYYYLFSIKKYLLDIGKGGTQANISQTVLKEVPIPVAPPDQQHQIVAKLDALMEKVQANKKRLEAIPTLLKRFRQAVLAAAVSGKLTEEWREENTQIEPAETLLSKILSHRTLIASKKLKKKTETYPNEHVNVSTSKIPRTWKWVKAGLLCEKIFDGTHFSPKNSASGAYKYITAKNIKENGIDLSNITFVSEEVHKEIYARADVKPNDILYIKDGATAGIATLNTLHEEFSLLSSVGVFRVNPAFVEPQYISYYLNGTKEQMLAKISGVAITRLTLEKLKDADISLPPFQEQQAIVQRVNELFALADAVEARYNQVKNQLDKLPQSILAKAFRAELVGEET